MDERRYYDIPRPSEDDMTMVVPGLSSVARLCSADVPYGFFVEVDPVKSLLMVSVVYPFGTSEEHRRPDQRGNVRLGIGQNSFRLFSLELVIEQAGARVGSVLNYRAIAKGLELNGPTPPQWLNDALAILPPPCLRSSDKPAR